MGSRFLEGDSGITTFFVTCLSTRLCLIDRAAPDYNFAEARLINNAGFPRR